MPSPRWKCESSYSDICEETSNKHQGELTQGQDGRPSKQKVGSPSFCHLLFIWDATRRWPTIRVRLPTLIKSNPGQFLGETTYSGGSHRWQIEMISVIMACIVWRLFGITPINNSQLFKMQRTAVCGVLSHKQDIWICILRQGSRNTDGEGPEILQTP